MLINKFKRLGLALVVATIGYACSKENGPAVEQSDASKDRKLILANLAEHVIIPSYENFKVKFDAMNSKAADFSSKPDVTTLAAFRLAWAEAYNEWQKVELFDFGPASDIGILNMFNIYPTSISGIQSYMDKPTESLEVVTSYDKQGFPALDYLLNEVGTTDAEIVAYYASKTDGPKRLAYVKRITDHMGTQLSAVLAGWKGAYYTTFTTKTGTDVGSPMGELVNRFVLHYERYLRSGKFGIPSGAMMNGVVAADKVEALYKKDISRLLAQTAHQAAWDFFIGKDVKTGVLGPSFKTYLDALGAKDSATGKMLSEVIIAQFATNKTKIDLLKPDFHQQILDNNQAMKDVYTELQKAVRMLKVDMTSAMSITITYTDNDGD